MGVLRDNLQPTDFADAVCRVSDWTPHPYYGLKEVRVWLCKCGSHWFQRHEWAREGVNSTELDEWIYSGYSNTRLFPETYCIDGFQILKDSNL